MKYVYQEDCKLGLLCYVEIHFYAAENGQRPRKFIRARTLASPSGLGAPQPAVEQSSVTCLEASVNTYLNTSRRICKGLLSLLCFIICIFISTEVLIHTFLHFQHSTIYIYLMTGINGSSRIDFRKMLKRSS